MPSFAFGPTRAEVVAASSTAGFVPLTGWIDAFGTTRVKAMVRLVYTKNANKLIVEMAYQTATTLETAPDNAVKLGTGSVQTMGAEDCTGMITTSFNSKRYVRFGVLVKSDGGTTPTWNSGEVLFAVSGRDQ
jgi:hypothetical protein